MSSYIRVYLTGGPAAFATSHITDRGNNVACPKNNAAAGYQGPVKEGTHMVRTLRLLTGSIANECFASTYVDLFLLLTATALASEQQKKYIRNQSHPRRKCALRSSTLKSLAQVRDQEAVFICLNRVHLRKVS